MIDGTDLAMLASSVRRAAAGRTGPDLDRELDAVGWVDALIADPAAATRMLFEIQGSTLMSSSALDRVLAHALTGDPSAGPVVVPPPGAWRPPGRVTAEGLDVRGLLVGERPGAGAVLVAAVGTAGEPVVGSVASGALTTRPVSGLDPGLGLVDVTAVAAAWSPAPAPDDGWAGARARGQVALGWELAGCARAMLDLACRHATERVQFGRPIGSFQAVRHRLAETLVAVEAAEAVLEAAEVDGGVEMAAVAKAVAGRSARTAARHSQQVLAGIGFTAEHPFHLYLRRSLVCDQLLGSARALTEDLGAGIVASGRLPAPLSL